MLYLNLIRCGVFPWVPLVDIHHIIIVLHCEVRVIFESDRCGAFQRYPKWIYPPFYYIVELVSYLNVMRCGAFPWLP